MDAWRDCRRKPTGTLTNKPQSVERDVRDLLATKVNDSGLIIRDSKMQISQSRRDPSRKPKEEEEVYSPSKTLQLESEGRLAQINIYHVEKSYVEESGINKAIRQTNHLIRSANSSYYHQSKTPFTLSVQDLKLIKKMGLVVGVMHFDSSSQSFFKSRDFQVALKEKALKYLN
jgi:hypothetical protein